VNTTRNSKQENNITLNSTTYRSFKLDNETLHVLLSVFNVQ